MLSRAAAPLTLTETLWLVVVVVVAASILLSQWRSSDEAATSDVSSDASGPAANVVSQPARPAWTELVPSAVQRTGELETRASLERIFGKPFPKVRPAFLVNPLTQRRLELDCYNDELHVAVEYDGIQHREFPNPFHRTRAEFEAQQQRDAFKAQECRKRGICFVHVPHTVARKHIEAFLRVQLQQCSGAFQTSSGTK